MEQLISLLTHYGYFILLPLAVIEGPIISVIAGLLCVMNVLNPFIVIPVIVSGDVIGDSFYYGLGRWSSKWSSNKLPPRALRRFIPGTEKVDLVRKYIDANPVRTIFLSKVILGVGVAGLYMAGNAKIPYRKFLPVCLSASLCQCTVYVFIGLLFGTAYQRIGSLLDGFATFTLLAAVATVLFFYVKSRLNKP